MSTRYDLKDLHDINKLKRKFADFKKYFSLFIIVIKKSKIPKHENKATTVEEEKTATVDFKFV